MGQDSLVGRCGAACVACAAHCVPLGRYRWLLQEAYPKHRLAHNALCGFGCAVTALDSSLDLGVLINGKLKTESGKLFNSATIKMNF